MRYMLLIYTREDAVARSSQEEMQQVMNGHLAVMRESRERGALEQAEPLANTSTATTVRWQNGATVITDGPFAETKEQLAGYYILNCDNLDEAVAWAQKIPTACGGLQGCVEVRPLREIAASSKVEEVLSSDSDHG
ncbi:MAG TPA: YciI family protein [Candidatus Angelobacter sp.]|nr:YciI family protein [Candidatus Angelobacter sp.]